nr:PREDICTED: testicular acid phosphatase homolog [Bemisia tabaci]XP_018898595.1 PREDICTED: testicular acid phosphatase homolog [Bemisia tabaci]
MERPSDNKKCLRKSVFSVPTLVIVLVIGVIACASFYFFGGSSKAGSSLRFVSIVHRHGDRSSEISYPLDPYKGETFWPEGPGALLQRGKVNMHRLGIFLRRRYDGFIPSAYNPADVHVLSTFIDRALMSAELVLSGLYPPVKNQIWNSDLLWQPVPVHSTTPSTDDMLRVSKFCPLLRKEGEQRKIFIRQKLNEHQEFLAYLSKVTGLDVKTERDVNHIYDNLQAVDQEGLPLPEWAKDIYPDKLKALAKIRYLEDFATPLMIKLSSGVFINELLLSMRRKIDSPENFERRLNLYSAHDLTLVRVWHGLNISQEITDNPPYGAALIFELHELKDKHRIKILYKRGSIDEDPEIVHIQGCEDRQAIDPDGMCDFDVFSSALQSVKITNFDEECRIPR